MPVPSLLVLVAVAQDAPPPAAPAVRVDPRIELVSLVARLAGFPEYAMPNSRSPYAAELEERFADLRDHEAVVRLRRLRREHGVSFDAVTGFAVHLTDDFEWRELVPFDPRPERLDERWPLAEARAFLEELRDFAACGDFEGFFADHGDFYARVEERLREKLAEHPILPWFDGFFGARAGAAYTAIPGLLCGGGNYGVGVRFADGRPERISPVFGCFDWDADGVPRFDSVAPLYAHELCHSYTNPRVDQFAAGLEGPGQRIWPGVAAAMSRQAYGNWRTLMYESLVRACTVRCLGAAVGPAEGRAAADADVRNGFAWVPALAVKLGEYEADRTTWPTFEAFMPEVVAFFAAYAAGLPAPDGG